MTYFALISSFIIWGFSPLYWKLLQDFNNIELASYRIIFSMFALFIYLNPKSFTHIIKQFNGFKLLFILSSLCMFINIYLFIYAINTNHILQASFGYFLSPLLSILLGVLFLNEKLTRLKKNGSNSYHRCDCHQSISVRNDALDISWTCSCILYIWTHQKIYKIKDK